jgi:hypothetical protein
MLVNYSKASKLQMHPKLLRKYLQEQYTLALAKEEAATK